jgi:predicted SAM-dependent methyltransferase
MLDMREPLPLPDGIARLIYSEHVFEHFGYPEPIGGLLRECLRLLEPGGMLSFAIPDGNLILEHYIKNNHPEVEEAHRRLNPEWCKTPMDHVNFCFRLVDYTKDAASDHKWYYDFDSMRAFLQDLGFTRINRRLFDPNLDQAERKIGPLYVECFRAATETMRAY